MEIISHNDYQNDFSVPKQILCLSCLSSLLNFLSVRAFSFSPFIRIKISKYQVTIVLCSFYWHAVFSLLKLETVGDMLSCRTAFICHKWCSSIVTSIYILLCYFYLYSYVCLHSLPFYFLILPFRIMIRVKKKKSSFKKL